MGDCPWQHGFWFYSWDCTSRSDDTGQFLVSIVKPDGSYSTTPPLNSYTSSSPYFKQLSESGDHFWFVVNKEIMGDNPDTPTVEDGYEWWYIYCVSRDALVIIDSVEIVQGGYFNTSWPNMTRVISVEFIDDLTVLAIYWVATGPCIGYYDDAIFTVPDPNESRAGERSLSCNSTTASAPCPEDNHVFSIQLSANPVTGTAALNFSTPVTGHATIQVFDLSGRTVDTLINEEVGAGNHSVSWTPENISSGVYFIRLTTSEGTVSTQAMVLR